jgi:hypothetical protein
LLSPERNEEDLADDDIAANVVVITDDIFGSLITLSIQHHGHQGTEFKNWKWVTCRRRDIRACIWGQNLLLMCRQLVRSLDKCVVGKPPAGSIIGQ